MRLAALALIGIIAAACAEGVAVDRNVLCDLNDCEIQPATAGAAGGVNDDG